MILAIALFETPRLRKWRISSSLPSRRETPSEIAHRMENHYSEQLYRYHNGIDERQPDLWSDTDPPF